MRKTETVAMLWSGRNGMITLCEKARLPAGAETNPAKILKETGWSWGHVILVDTCLPWWSEKSFNSGSCSWMHWEAADPHHPRKSFRVGVETEALENLFEIAQAGFKRVHACVPVPLAMMGKCVEDKADPVAVVWRSERKATLLLRKKDVWHLWNVRSSAELNATSKVFKNLIKREVGADTVAKIYDSDKFIDSEQEMHCGALQYWIHYSSALHRCFVPQKMRQRQVCINSLTAAQFVLWGVVFLSPFLLFPLYQKNSEIRKSIETLEYELVPYQPLSVREVVKTEIDVLREELIDYSRISRWRHWMPVILGQLQRISGEYWWWHLVQLELYTSPENLSHELHGRLSWQIEGLGSEEVRTHEDAADSLRAIRSAVHATFMGMQPVTASAEQLEKGWYRIQMESTAEGIH